MAIEVLINTNLVHFEDILVVEPRTNFVFVNCNIDLHYVSSVNIDCLRERSPIKLQPLDQVADGLHCVVDIGVVDVPDLMDGALAAALGFVADHHVVISVELAFIGQCHVLVD